VKGIQVCSKEGDNPSPKGDNSEILKYKYINFFSSEAGGKNQSNLVLTILQ
jgi:hypothetical protein